MKKIFAIIFLLPLLTFGQTIKTPTRSKEQNLFLPAPAYGQLEPVILRVGVNDHEWSVMYSGYVSVHHPEKTIESYEQAKHAIIKGRKMTIKPGYYHSLRLTGLQKLNIDSLITRECYWICEDGSKYGLQTPGYTGAKSPEFPNVICNHDSASVRKYFKALNTVTRSWFFEFDRPQRFIKAGGLNLFDPNMGPDIQETTFQKLPTKKK